MYIYYILRARNNEREEGQGVRRVCLNRFLSKLHHILTRRQDGMNFNIFQQTKCRYHDDNIIIVAFEVNDEPVGFGNAR
jgi:hypothetical protein